MVRNLLIVLYTHKLYIIREKKRVLFFFLGQQTELIVRKYTTINNTQNYYHQILLDRDNKKNYLQHKPKGSVL